MKKLGFWILSILIVLLVVFGLLRLHIELNRCFEGDCENGIGSYNYYGSSIYHINIFKSPRSYYIGEWKNGKRHGNGKSFEMGRLRYSGEWKNGKHHGNGTKFYFHGEMKYKGEWENGKYHGNGKYFESDRLRYSGEWKNGKKHGYGTQFSDLDGLKMYKGEWENDKRHGYGTQFRPNGLKMCEGEWENGKLNGKAAFYSEVDSTRLLLDGQWENNKLYYGTTYIFYPVRSLKSYVGELKGEFKEGWPEPSVTWEYHGKGTNFNNSQLYYDEGEWKNGKMHGKFKRFEGKFTNTYDLHVTYNKYPSEEGEYDNGKRIDKPYSLWDWDDESLKEFFTDRQNLPLEGVYRGNNNKNDDTWRFLVLKDIKDNYNYIGYLIDGNCIGCQHWTTGDVKFTMTESTFEGLFDVTWKKSKKKTKQFIFLNELGGHLSNKEDISLIKIFPKLGLNKKVLENDEWAGNGSGLIISTSGHIITNSHVIEEANDIEVEFLIDDEVQKHKAEIVKIDKVNDLAVIKIEDVDFSGVKKPPYNFKKRSSDVGTKVYAFGYPMALTIMGKDLKVTDGIISSKTGYEGDITKYQITAPIQDGNSGGPLFDDKGNLIAINSSKLKNEIASNVGYSIKTTYVLNLIDVLPESISLPSSTQLASKELTEQIKILSEYVVLIKVK